MLTSNPIITFNNLEELDPQIVIDYLKQFPKVAFCPWSDKYLLQKLIALKQLTGFVAFHDHKIIGAVLGGCIGLRGTINHLAVEDSFQRQKIGKNLVDKMVAYFIEQGIRRIFVFCMKDSETALNFWLNSEFQIHENEVTLERDI